MSDFISGQRFRSGTVANGWIGLIWIAEEFSVDAFAIDANQFWFDPIQFADWGSLAVRIVVEFRIHGESPFNRDACSRVNLYPGFVKSL